MIYTKYVTQSVWDKNRSNLYLGYYEYMVNTMVATVTRPQLVVLFMQNKCVFVFKDDWSVVEW